MTTLPKTSDQMADHFSAPVIKAGYSLFERGLVRNVSRVKANGITAEVWSSSKGPRLTTSVKLVGEVLSGSCSCGLGRGCEHMVAALAASAAREAAPPAAAPDLPEIRNDPATAASEWIEAVQRAVQRTPYGRTSHEWPANVHQRLLYVIDMGDEAEPIVSFYKGRLCEEGRIEIPEQNKKPWDGRPYYSTNNFPVFVSEGDRKIWVTVTEAGLDRPAFRRLSTPGRAKVRKTIDDIIDSGRGRFRTPSGPTLSHGEARDARFEWITDDTDNSTTLRLTDSAGRSIRLLIADRPMYVDPLSGAVGELRSAMDEFLLRKLEASPKFSAAETVEVAIVLKSLDQPGLPLPPSAEIVPRDDVSPTAHVRLTATIGDANVRSHLLPRSEDRQFDRPGRQVRAEAEISVRYDGTPVTDWSSGYVRRRSDGLGSLILRDPEAERAEVERAMSALAAEGFKAREVRHGRYWEASLTDPTAFGCAEFAKRLSDRLEAVGVALEVDRRWPSRFHEGPISIRTRFDETGSGLYTFDLQIEAASESESILDALLTIVQTLPVNHQGMLPDDFDLDRFLETRQVLHRMKSGKMVRLPTELVRPLVLALIAAHDLRGEIHPARAAEMAVLAEAAGGTADAADVQKILELGRRLRAIAQGASRKEPAGFVGELREYQRKALGWMSALAELGFGGCLADEMGLGKTVSTCAYLVDRHLGGKASAPSLVMGTASMVLDWERELGRFAPEMKIGVFHGADRQKILERIENHQVLITSYKIGLSDIDALEKIHWDTVVLDEAHRPRNRDTETASMVRRLQAKARFALTGTPLNNHLEDLWALYDWLIPGLLGSRQEFTEEFRTAIEKDGSTVAQARLNRIIRPFLLRRIKREVAKDLPPKTEILEPIRFGEEQRALYDATRLAMLTQVKLAIAARGLRKSRMTILSCLLKLRQICCDPKLLKLKEADDIPSAKLERLMDLVTTRLAEGGRIVIFSQFVEMMNEISSRLESEKVDHFVLSGNMSLKKRRDAVARFQKGERDVFLVSLHAGGEGITVTAADTVVLYDCWWSPTAEMQAQDRVHRIGQDREVFVYRLIAENTVEEGILEIQKRKQALADALWTGEGSGQPFELSESDVYALFGETGS